jgi:hypothetical protein
MKIYKHIGAGHYIGSCVIVISENEETAKTMIRKMLDDEGLEDEPLNVVRVPTKPNTIVYKHNGDY